MYILFLLFSVPLLGERIAIVDEARSVVDVHKLTNQEIIAGVIFFLLEIHTRIMGHNGDLGELSSSQKKREVVLARVGFLGLLDFNSIISKEEIEGIQLHTSFKGSVIPDDVKTEDFSVVFKILLQAIVGMPTLELDFEIFLVFFSVRRRDLEVLNSHQVFEVVARLRFRVVEGDTLVVVEFLGEIVTVGNSENSFTDVDVGSKVEVLKNRQKDE